MLQAVSPTQRKPFQETTLSQERDHLVRFCAYLTGDPTQAEDLAQETLIIAWRHQDKLYSADHQAKWLRGIARNLCRNWARKQRPVLAGLDDEILSAQPGEGWSAATLERPEHHNDHTDLLERGLRQLPTEARTLLIEAYIEERPQQELAHRLGLSPKALSMRLSRAKAQLKQSLTAEGTGVADGAVWHPTQVWCLGCGQARLQIRRQPDGLFSVRCPVCSSRPEASLTDFRLTNNTFAQLLGHITQPRALLNRAAGWAHTYFSTALSTQAALCTHCGQAARFRFNAHHQELAAFLGDKHLLSVTCEACDEQATQSFAGFVHSLPGVQAFWRAHPRLRRLPAHEIDAAGHVAIVTSFASISNATQLDVIIRRDTLQVLALQPASRNFSCAHPSANATLPFCGQGA